MLAAFAAACVLLALTPGPNMALIVAATLSRGLRAGLATLAGTTTGLVLQVTAAAAGMTSIMVFMSAWFDAVRWAGALYLVWLGARQLWRLRAGDGGPAGVQARTHGRPYADGLIVSLSNPKTLLFLGAFLPQFVDPAGDAVRQLAWLAALFVAIVAGVDTVTTLAAARARGAVTMARRRLLDGAAGVMLLLGGLALAVARRP